MVLRKVLVVILVFFSLAVPVTLDAQVEALAALGAVQEALKGIHDAISQMDVAARDRLKQVDALIQTSLTKIDDVLEKHRKGLIKDTDALITKTFGETNETLYAATSGLGQLESAFSADLNNAIVNAAKVVGGVPFSNIRPFIALAYPAVFVPNRQSGEYEVGVIGFFNDKWPKPQATLRDTNQSLQSTMTAGNRLTIAIPADIVNPRAGKRLRVTVAFPVSKPFLRAHKYDARDVAVSILPKVPIKYRVVESKALPDIAFDSLVRTFDENTEAPNCETRDRDISKTFNDLSGPVDTNVYELAKSKIAGASTAGDGNNPDGQNGSSVSVDATGQVVVLKQKARGSCRHWVSRTCTKKVVVDISYPCDYLANAEGANRHDHVTVDLRLARIRQEVDWKLTGGAGAGELRWGETIQLTPEGGRELTRLRLEVQDFSFDPPQMKIVGVGGSYRSEVATVESAAQTISMRVRSFRSQFGN